MLAHEADAQLQSSSLPPSSGRVRDESLGAIDAMGMLYVGVALSLTAVGSVLSGLSHPLVWFAGQVIVAVALLQWFIVLHEAGHMSLFRTRALNVAAGHLASVFALIPYASWRRVHGLHHVWTGWQDKDPTTAALTPRNRSRLQVAIVDAAWRLWLPLFSVLYRLSNYWHLPRLMQMFPSKRQRCAIVANAVLLLAFYVGVAMFVGLDPVLKFAGLAIVLGLALQDPIILSQHTHIPQQVSAGKHVEPLSGEGQLRFTRSLRFPRWFARCVLINFNAHELHHLHASVPGYRLPRLKDAQPNEVDWWTWLRAAKRMRGSQFVFGNRDQTGFEL